MAKYDFQKPSKIPYLETAGYKTLIRLKKRRFRCKGGRKMAVAETLPRPEKSPDCRRSQTENCSIIS